MKGGSVYIVSQRDRVFCFQELDRIGAVPAVHLERAREWARQRTCHPRTLHGPGPVSDRNPDWRCARKQTTAQQDFSCPQWSVIAVKLS
jgi:hypothetical protein